MTEFTVRKESVYVPKGYELTISADADTSGSYVQANEPGGEVVYTPEDISAETDVVLGPFNSGRWYDLISVDGLLTYTQVYSGIYTKADEDALVAIPAEPDAVSTLANDANGTAIAAAVNAINAILIATGLAVSGD